MAIKMLNLQPISFRFQAVILNTSQMPHSQNLNPIPRLSFTKPSWVVRTESNVHKEKIRTPDPPCLVCSGSGRVDCHYCQGRGRTNCTHLEMLPKGEWPKWCKTCGGSGLGYCDRCIGTGEYRDIMGFHFMKRETQDSPAQTDQKRRTIADLYNSELSADA